MLKGGARGSRIYVSNVCIQVTFWLCEKLDLVQTVHVSRQVSFTTTSNALDNGMIKVSSCTTSDKT